MLILSHALHSSPTNGKTLTEVNKASRSPKQSCLFLESHRCCLFKSRCCKLHKYLYIPWPLALGLQLPIFHKWRHGGPERLSSLPKVTQLVSGLSHGRHSKGITEEKTNKLERGQVTRFGSRRPLTGPLSQTFFCLFIYKTKESGETIFHILWFFESNP